MDLLTALVGAYGDHADAIVVDGVPTSWADLAGRADRLGRELRGAAAVAVPATPTLETVVAVVAGLRAGVRVVPVPADAGPIERAHIVRDSSASLIAGAPEWPEIDVPRVAVPADEGRGGASSTIDRGVGAPGASALVVYTSGTTGLPKGVVLSAAAIAADLDGLADAWAWTPDDTLVHGLPLFHVHGLVLGVLGALRTGSKLIHTGRPTPEGYAAAGGSLYFGVPTVWSRLVAAPDRARSLRSARLLVSGSAPLPVPVFEAMTASCGQAPVERYGMTETLITLSTRADGERRPGSVGLPVAGVETRARGDDGELVAPDGETIGGLEVRGPTLFDGYLDLPEKTAEATTADGWFVTGDAVTIGPDGFHRIVGRASIDVIKCGGFKVGAGEVEATLLTHPTVAEAAVVGVPDDDLGERIVAYVVGEGCDEAVLIDHVGGALSQHKRPREVRVVTELPRNAMGKVQKHRLR